MSIGVILLLIIGSAVGVYFMFFNESKQDYSAEKIKEIFNTVSDILAHHPDDHDFISSRKEKLSSDLVSVKRYYSRTPSVYTKEEVSSLEKMVSETKESMRGVCENMIEYKPALVSLIESSEENLRKLKAAFESIKDSEEDEDDGLDFIEKNIELIESKLPKLKTELTSLEKSLINYQNI